MSSFPENVFTPPVKNLRQSTPHHIYKNTHTQTVFTSLKGDDVGREKLQLQSYLVMANISKN